MIYTDSSPSLARYLETPTRMAKRSGRVGGIELVALGRWDEAEAREAKQKKEFYSQSAIQLCSMTRKQNLLCQSRDSRFPASARLQKKVSVAMHGRLHQVRARGNHPCNPEYAHSDLLRATREGPMRLGIHRGCRRCPMVDVRDGQVTSEGQETSAMGDVRVALLLLVVRCADVTER